MTTQAARSNDTDPISDLRLSPRTPTDPRVGAMQSASQERLGYVRNFLKIPFGEGLLPLYQAYIDGLMRSKDRTLPPLERELIALVVSAENRCEVCVISHATALERHGMPKETVDIVTLNWRRAQLSVRERALCDFAWRLTVHASEAEESWLEKLRAVGLSEEEILETAQIVAIFNANNRFNTVIGLHMNPEAHAAYRAR